MKKRGNLSRREWLERVSVPPLAASLGTSLFGTAAVAAQQPSRPAVDDKTLGAHVYNIRDFGAQGDGATLDTMSVQAAIDACTKNKGGTVLVPAGDFVVGTLELRSNVTLHLAARGRHTANKQLHQRRKVQARFVSLGLCVKFLLRKGDFALFFRSAPSRNQISSDVPASPPPHIRRQSRDEDSSSLLFRWEAAAHYFDRGSIFTRSG